MRIRKKKIVFQAQPAQHWSDALRKKYPWFPDRAYCESGWEELLWELCVGIQKYLKRHGAYRTEFSATSCKEKYGSLRFYVTPNNDVIDKLIDAAEIRSYKTCEQCGQPGKLRKQNYVLFTACERCAELRLP